MAAIVRLSPTDDRHDHVLAGLEPAPESDQIAEQLAQDVRKLAAPLVAEGSEPVVDRVVVVLLGLDAGIRWVLDGGVELELASDRLRQFGELVHGVGGIELIEHAVLPGSSGMLE